MSSASRSPCPSRILLDAMRELEERFSSAEEAIDKQSNACFFAQFDLSSDKRIHFTEVRLPRGANCIPRREFVDDGRTRLSCIDINNQSRDGPNLIPYIESALDQRRESSILGEPAHDDEVVDGNTLLTEIKDPEIHIGRVEAIELHLAVTVRLTFAPISEVKKLEAQRLS